MSLSGQDISIVVPVNNGGDNFVKCMRSLLETSPPPGEIVVVIDGGNDETWMEAKKPGVRVIREAVSGGPAKARNQGARETVGDIILFIDADVVVPVGLIGQVAESLGQDPKVAAVIGSYDDEPAAVNFCSRYKNLFHHFTHQQSDAEASTFWGACGAIRREPFLAVGGFDESYRNPSVEDIELGYRLRASGHRIKLVKSLQIKHLKYWSPISQLKTDFFQRAIPWSELILRRRLFINDLNLRISSRLSVLAIFGILCTVGGALVWHQLLAVAMGLAVFLWALNARLVVFFSRKGGTWFGVRAMAWHCLYYLYSGIGFATAIILHLLLRGRAKLFVILHKVPLKKVSTL